MKDPILNVIKHPATWVIFTLVILVLLASALEAPIYGKVADFKLREAGDLASSGDYYGAINKLYEIEVLDYSKYRQTEVNDMKLTIASVFEKNSDYINAMRVYIDLYDYVDYTEISKVSIYRVASTMTQKEDLG